MHRVYSLSESFGIRIGYKFVKLLVYAKGIVRQSLGVCIGYNLSEFWYMHKGISLSESWHMHRAYIRQSLNICIGYRFVRVLVYALGISLSDSWYMHRA